MHRGHRRIGRRRADDGDHPHPAEPPEQIGFVAHERPADFQMLLSSQDPGGKFRNEFVNRLVMG